MSTLDGMKFRSGVEDAMREIKIMYRERGLHPEFRRGLYMADAILRKFLKMKLVPIDIKKRL